jgi:ribonuclease HI
MNPALRLQEAALRYADVEGDEDYARAWQRLVKAAQAYCRPATVACVACGRRYRWVPGERGRAQIYCSPRCGREYRRRPDGE